jgi:hypothetical protein
LTKTLISSILFASPKATVHLAFSPDCHKRRAPMPRIGFFFNDYFSIGCFAGFATGNRITLDDTHHACPDKKNS